MKLFEYNYFTDAYLPYKYANNLELNSRQRAQVIWELALSRWIIGRSVDSKQDAATTKTKPIKTVSA